MNLLETILDSKGGALGQIARQFGLPESTVTQAVSALTPALARGLERNASQPGGLDSLLSALGSGKHQHYLDEPQKLVEEATIADGNAILGHIFGSKDVSRDVAGAAAEQTGVDSSLLRKLLPVLATVAMGALSKQTSGGSQLSALSGSSSSGDALGILSGFVGADKDGSSADDLLNPARRFL